MRIIYVFIFTFIGFAYEFPYLVRSPKALLMGDAYTAIADDGPYTLFYNPALAARNNLLSFYPLPFHAGITDPIKERNTLEDASDTNDQDTFVNILVDKPIHLNVGAVPTIKLGWFTFTPFADNKTNFIIRNSVNPELDLDYRYDRGFVAGLGIKVGKEQSGSLAVGFAAKYIKRQAIVSQFPAFGDKVANLINEPDLNAGVIRRNLGYAEGKGWGADFGLDYRLVKGPQKFGFGVAVLDIADTKIKKYEGNLEVPNQLMNISAGLSYGMDYTLIDWELTFDMHPINANIQNMQKIHAGFRLGIPFIDVFLGWNGGHVSYGAGLDLFPIEVVVGFYGKERGESIGDETSNRVVIYASLFDFTFDGP